jgi:hypothetical protein
LVEIVPALGSENHSSRGSPYQRHTQMGLERGEFSAHRRNWHVQRTRGLANTLKFRDFYKNQYVIEVLHLFVASSGCPTGYKNSAFAFDGNGTLWSVERSGSIGQTMAGD